MAVTTYAQAWAKFKAAQKLAFGVVKPAAMSSSPNFVDQAITYETTAQAEGRQASDAAAGITSWRSALASILGGTSVACDPLLWLITRSASVISSATTPQRQLDDLIKYMAETSGDRVTSRGFTDGSFTSGSPYTGNGVWERCTTDQYGYPMEARFAEKVTVKCVQDAAMGAPFKGREVFQVDGYPYIDVVEWGRSNRGSGITNGRISGINADDSLLQNASFSVTPPGGDDAMTSVPNWTASPTPAGTGLDYEIDRTNYYQESQKENRSPASLVIHQAAGAVTLTQKLRTVGIKATSTEPWYSRIAWRADLGASAWTGTIQLALGSQTISYTVAGETGWNLLKKPGVTTVTTHKNLWLKNWDNGADTAVVITITPTGAANSQLNIDSAILCPYVPVRDPRNGGTYYYLLPVSGSTDWKYRDIGTWTDTEVGGVVVQDGFHRTYGRCLPSAPASPTAAAPSAALSATAGSVTTGTHLVAFSYVDAWGQESGLSSASSSVTGDGTKNVDVTGLPASPPANVVSLKLYMTKAGTSTPFYYTGKNPAAGVTSQTGASGISVADGSLTVASVDGVTSAGSEP